jgi:hypothetical protein
VTILLSRDKQRAMKTSIEHIRAKITELEARITDLRIAERELAALDTAPAPRRKSKAKAKRMPRTDAAAEAPQTVGAAITEVLNRTGALPLAELAEQITAAGHGQEWRRQMDAAEDTHEESPCLTVLPRDYGMLVR